MNKKLPNIFIGSSTENLDTAYAIQENLERDAICRVWTQGIFDLSNDALDNLLKATKEFEYAIFVFNPEDITKIRNVELRTVRDNIIFEFGVFISKLGKDRVFFLIPHDVKDLHLPTDLIGLEPGKYFPQVDRKNLLAALGPFCNKIRNIITSNQANLEEIPSLNENEIRNESINSKEHHSNEKIIEIDYGVIEDEFGNRIITKAPTVFFSYRFAKSFPGIRDTQWINDPIKALDRLELLLKEPLKFERGHGHGVTSDPIWWFRGSRDMNIDEFKRLDDTRFLMDYYELKIKKIAAYNGGSYWQCFVYIETYADKPIGLYAYDDYEFNSWKERNGFIKEEYGLFEGIPISRSCYDDGAAEINGKIIDTSDAELRARVLTDYNFIISSKFSPMNTREFRTFSEPILNGILNGTNTLDEIIDFFNALPRHRNED